MAFIPSHSTASEIADLTFKLLVSYQKKEERIARQFGVTVAEFRIRRVFRDDAGRGVFGNDADLSCEGRGTGRQSVTTA